MAKRDIVKVNFEKLICLVENTEWTQAAFARLVGKHNRWLSSVAKGKNLPSPEEAAKMCLLLQTTPEEILLHSGPTEKETQKCLEDIEEVKRLIEVERGKNVKKEAPAEVGGGKDALLDFIRKTDDRTTLLAVLDEVNKKLQEMR